MKIAKRAAQHNVLLNTDYYETIAIGKYGQLYRVTI